MRCPAAAQAEAATLRVRVARAEAALLALHSRGRGQPRREEPLTGLYAGQPKRTTAKPTTEMLLRAFRGINLVLLPGAGACTGHLPPLTPLQERLLRRWGLPRDTDTRLMLAATHPHPLAVYPALYESLHPSPE